MNVAKAFILGAERGTLLGGFSRRRINIEQSVFQSVFMRLSACWSKESLGV
jgi:hypothetical protein